MKKLTEYKELDAATFDNSRLPIKNCVFKQHKDYGWGRIEMPLLGIQADGGRLKFRHIDGLSCYAAEIITRYPREVPEGVDELPEDKPFLAYLPGERLSDKSYPNAVVYSHSIMAKKWNERYEKWWCSSIKHAAIDVSTQWAAKNFPELVEAMEYEPLIEGEPCHEEIFGHKLGDKTYDLEWKQYFPFSTKLGIKIKECGSPMIHKDSSGSENGEIEPLEEPLDFEDYYTTGYLLDSSYGDAKLDFYAGKARGKWESDQHWKKILKKVGIEIK